MGGVIAGLIARWGEPVRLYNAETSTEIRAILQPLRHRGWDQMRADWTALGGQAPGRYLLLSTDSPAGYDMAGRAGTRYWLRRWEACRIGGEVLYYWALLTKEDDDGTDL